MLGWDRPEIWNLSTIPKQEINTAKGKFYNRLSKKLESGHTVLNFSRPAFHFQLEQVSMKSLSRNLEMPKTGTQRGDHVAHIYPVCPVHPGLLLLP